MKRMLKRSMVVAMAAGGMATGLAAPAQASDAPGVLCRAWANAVVYSPNTWQPKYIIAAGHDMRVHYASGGWYYGHSAARNDDGWADPYYFGACR